MLQPMSPAHYWSRTVVFKLFWRLSSLWSVTSATLALASIACLPCGATHNSCEDHWMRTPQWAGRLGGVGEAV
jgi:hypothetical protein